jgi:hypothetical protein
MMMEMEVERAGKRNYAHDTWGHGAYVVHDCSEVHDMRADTARVRVGFGSKS